MVDSVSVKADDDLVQLTRQTDGRTDGRTDGHGDSTRHYSVTLNNAAD